MRTSRNWNGLQMKSKAVRFHYINIVNTAAHVTWPSLWAHRCAHACLLSFLGHFVPVTWSQRCARCFVGHWILILINTWVQGVRMLNTDKLCSTPSQHHTAWARSRALIPTAPPFALLLAWLPKYSLIATACTDCWPAGWPDAAALKSCAVNEKMNNCNERMSVWLFVTWWGSGVTLYAAGQRCWRR